MLDNGTAAEAACRIGDGLGDPENPPCARLVISGTMTKVQTGSAEDEAARAALFERHASFKNYPKDHGFYVAKMTLDGVTALFDFTFAKTTVSLPILLPLSAKRRYHCPFHFRGRR